MTRLPVFSLFAVIAACLFAPLAAWSQGGAPPQGGPPMTRAQHMAKLKAEREQRFADARKRSEAARADQQRIDDEQDANAQKEAEEANKRWEEMRARNAEQIRKFDEAIEDWRDENPSPPGTVEEFVSSSYDEETALGESARIVFYNRQDVPTHQIEFGPDGKPTGPVTLTQQGKAWETIGPQLKDGAQWEPVYGRDPYGDITIVSADIIKDGRTVSRFHFNEEGVPWKGENWRYDGVPRGEPGINSGGFYDPRLEPKPATLGTGFDVPAPHRQITGVCPQCREKADRFNELAARANRLLADMRAQSEEHKHKHRAAQIPIEQRYAHLKAEYDALLPELEAARAAALECEKICRPQSKLPAPDLTRPSLIPVAKLEPPASFCDEFARVAYMNEVYTPAAKASLANAQTATAHLGKLGGMFTDYMKNEGGPGWAAVREEQAAYGPIAETATKDSNAINAMYQRILAIPIIPCSDQKPRIATGDPAPPPVAPAPDEVGVIPARMVEQATGAKKPCPPKGPRKPIVVGPNSKVGSGAQQNKKLGGMLVGGLLGAAGVGGGGGGGGGPQLYKCTLKDSKLTLFKHPSGLTLGIGAQRGKGDNVLITADIQKAPDKGTFQAALLEKPGTQQLQPPSEVGPCDLWGEWELTVSWSKTTTVDGKVVSHETGGWSEGGKFTLPGQLSKVDNADALWKRMGFSSASHGAQKAIMAFKVPPGGGPLTFTTWITQPKGDPVMAVPITVTMTETTPGVFTFTEGEADCPYSFDTVLTTTAPPVPATRPGDRPGADPPLTGGGAHTQNPWQPDREVSEKVENLLEGFVAEDLKLIDRMMQTEVCDPAARAQLEAKLRERLMFENDDEAGPDLKEAAELDEARTQALLDWLSDDPEACRPPGQPPKPPPEHFDAAHAPYTPPDGQEEGPDLGAGPAPALPTDYAPSRPPLGSETVRTFETLQEAQTFARDTQLAEESFRDQLRKACEDRVNVRGAHNGLMGNLRSRLSVIETALFTGPDAAASNVMMQEERLTLLRKIKEAEEFECPPRTATAPAGRFPTGDPSSPEDIIDDMEDEGTKANPAFGSRPADPVPPKDPPKAPAEPPVLVPLPPQAPMTTTGTPVGAAPGIPPAQTPSPSPASSPPAAAPPAPYQPGEGLRRADRLIASEPKTLAPREVSDPALIERHLAQSTGSIDELRKSLDKARQACTAGTLGVDAIGGWEDERRRLLDLVNYRIVVLKLARPVGPQAKAVQDQIDSALLQASELYDDIAGQAPPTCPASTPKAPPRPAPAPDTPESILDDIDEVFVPA